MDGYEVLEILSQLETAVSLIKGRDSLLFLILTALLLACCFTGASMLWNIHKKHFGSALFEAFMAGMLFIGTQSLYGSMASGWQAAYAKDERVLKACRDINAAISTGHVRYLDDEQTDLVLGSCNPFAFYKAANAPKSQLSLSGNGPERGG